MAGNVWFLSVAWSLTVELRMGRAMELSEAERLLETAQKARSDRDNNLDESYCSSLAILWQHVRKLTDTDKERSIPRQDEAELRLKEAKAALIQQKEELKSLRSQIGHRNKAKHSNNQTIELTREKLENLKTVHARLLQDKQAYFDEVLNNYKAHQKAKSFYKEKLRIYYTVDINPDTNETVVFFQFFTKSKSNNDGNSLTVLCNKDNSYQLIKTSPHLEIFDDLKHRLKETGDIVGLICCVRKCFAYQLQFGVPIC